MTEAEWMASGDPDLMVSFLLKARHRAGTLGGRLRAWLGGRQPRLVTDRQLRLFVCAFCQAHRSIFDCEPDRQILELARAILHRGPSYSGETPLPPAAYYVAGACRRPAEWNGDPLDIEWPEVWWAVGAIIDSAVRGEFIGPTVEARRAAREAATNRERRRSAELLRDIVGNPFRTDLFPPEWRTDTVRAISRRMYESGVFDAMPILADAMQEAGCDHPDVLDHCRGPGPHVRGCRVVDLVLARE